MWARSLFVKPIGSALLIWFFAPTVLDGGDREYSTGDGSGRQVVRGFRDALATERVLAGDSAATTPTVSGIYLSQQGRAHATDTQAAIDRALCKPSSH